MLKKAICLLLLLFAFDISNAQDPHFSQYNVTRLNTNPAFTGSDSTVDVLLGGRIEWPQIDGGYKTYNFSADNYYHWLQGGLGLNLSHDDQMNGTFKTNRIDLSYAPHFEFFQHKLAVQCGFEASYFQKYIDWSKLTFGDMIDERRGFVYNTNEVPGQSKKSIIDLSTGILIYTQHFYGGLAVHHLTQPDEGLVGPSPLPMKITVHTGANLNFHTKNFILSPNVLWMRQQDFQTLLPGITAKYKFIVLGISYRNEDAFIINAGLQWHFLKLGYSYDYTTSKLTNTVTGGSHELHLTLYMLASKKRKALSLRMI